MTIKPLKKFQHRPISIRETQPVYYEEAYRANRRRVQGNRSKRLQKKRSELVERSFAHMCETGGAGDRLASSALRTPRPIPTNKLR
ncbi:MAG: hypothetical protein IH899_04800 [Planctomycetes bacterium]|nr:hypothetical protein [Planctomycetota bacterium]